MGLHRPDWSNGHLLCPSFCISCFIYFFFTVCSICFLASVKTFIRAACHRRTVAKRKGSGIKLKMVSRLWDAYTFQVENHPCGGCHSISGYSRLGQKLEI